MSTVPERISVKRRRDDDAIDTLVLQRDKDSKKRVTDHVYRRITETRNLDASKHVNPPRGPLAATNGIPVVRVTSPGDELTPYKHGNAAIANPSSALNRSTQGKTKEDDQIIRQFKLTRDLSSTSSRGTSDPKARLQSSLRPHLPTFVERTDDHLRHDPRVHAHEPRDRIVSAPRTQQTAATSLQGDSDNKSVTTKELRPFIQAQKGRRKNGRSIRDSPDTWDLESDQLANELAALAMEMDTSIVQPEATAPAQAPAAQRSYSDMMTMDDADEYVFETYVRVVGEAGRRADFDSNIGYLVIEEGDEELWDQYVRDEEEDEDDWNEEDEDSNAEDNPRNDYPDEDWSSDDEFDRGTYRHRRNASDNEEFDQERD